MGAMSTPAVPGGPRRRNPPDADIRASDRERDEAAGQLRDHTAAGRLTLEEFSARLEATAQARTRGELAAVLADLPVAPSAPAARVTHREWAVAVFSDDTRTGRWNPGSRTGAVSVFGHAELDLRKAEVTGARLDIGAYALFGDVTIIVPEGAPVELSRTAVFGDVTAEVDGDALPGMPTVRVRAVSVFGDVSIRSTPRPPGFLARLFER